MKTKLILLSFLLISQLSIAQKPELYSSISSGAIGDLRFINNDTAFCFNNYNVFIGINTAKNWSTSKTLQFGGAYTFTALDAKNNLIIAGLNTGGRYHISKDAGKTWSDVKFIGKNLGVNALKIIDTNTIYALLGSGVGVTDSVLLYISEDGGDNWQRRSTIPARGSNAKIEFLNANIGLLYFNKNLYKTNDAGQTWVKPLGYDTTSNVLSTYILSEQIAYIGQDNGGLLKSQDNHNSFTMINANSGLDYENKIYFKDIYNGFITEGYTRDFKLKATSDGGISWVKIADSVNFKYLTYLNNQNIFLYGGNNNLYKVNISGTSVNDIRNNSIVIYPNPSNGIINITLNKASDNKLELYRITGQLINEYELTEGLNQIKIEERGMYFIKIGSNLFEKIIIK